MKTVFSIQNALVFQKQDLARWERVLKPEVYEKIRLMTTAQNHLAQTGYDICRGDSITYFVLNYNNIA
jgi:hypothetical protein